MNRKVVIGIVLVGVFLGTTSASYGVLQGPPKPDVVWPVSWISLGTAILLLLDILARLFGVYKVGAGALEKKLDEQEEKQAALLKAQTDHFDVKMNQVEQRLEQKFNSYTGTSELRMNGFGARITEVEADQLGANAKLTVFEGRMSRSEMDREHINKTLTDIKKSQETILEYIINQPRRP